MFELLTLNLPDRLGSQSVAVSALEELDQSSSGGGGTSLTISNAENILGDANLGDSISVNGELNLS